MMVRDAFFDEQRRGASDDLVARSRRDFANAMTIDTQLRRLAAAFDWQAP